MEIWETNKLLLFIIFIIPGFIIIKFYELLLPINKQQDLTKKLVDAIAYSCTNYALLSVPIILILNNVNSLSPYVVSAFSLFALFIFPIVIALAWMGLRKCYFFQKFMPHPTSTAWVYFFSKCTPCWIKVHLKDGSKVAGRYAYNSFCSTVSEDIYLEESWLISNERGFERIKNQTEGILIFAREISYIEFYKYYEDIESNEQ